MYSPTAHLTDPLPPDLAPHGSPNLKRLVWVYFWLLIFEGALRKWFVPGLSAPLLVIRDPVVILIYVLAFRENLIPQSSFLKALFGVGLASAFLACIQFLTLGIPAHVLAYGWRADFLHFPLIFILPRIFAHEDIIKMGKAVLALSIPMALLMAQQFRSDPSAWINRTVGASEGPQLASALGKIRPPGTFSFITGAVSFFTMVAAFTAHAIAERASYPRLLGLAAGVAIVLAMAVSGSRSAIISVALVFVFWAAGAMASRRLVATATRLAGFAIVATLLVTNLSFFRDEVTVMKQGAEVMSERWNLASQSESATGGLIGRFTDQLLNPLKLLFTIPFFGHGLGVGTNAGAYLISGKAQFLLSEGEWGRVLMEMGPLVGLMFIAFRIMLVLSLGRLSIQSATKGHLLPILLFGAAALPALNGQIAQPTALGFATLLSGLCLASAEAKRGQLSSPSEAPKTMPLPKRMQGPRALPPRRPYPNAGGKRPHRR
ncbi:MAG TPA: hypothetical protein VEH27_17250 [Methylomirabilota bacterium]|nr:hypothetical protein [Methylomirabilota bacterium]